LGLNVKENPKSLPKLEAILLRNSEMNPQSSSFDRRI